MKNVHNNLDDCRNLQHNINFLSSWCKTNSMEFNSKEIDIIFISTKINQWHSNYINPFNKRFIQEVF